MYCTHCVLHISSTTSSQDGLCPAPGQSLMSHLSVDLFVDNSLHCHNYRSIIKYSLSSCCTSGSIYHLQINCVHIDSLQIECLQVLLRSRLINNFKIISILTKLSPQSVFLSSLNITLQVCLQTPLITASKSISQLSRLHCGKPVKVPLDCKANCENERVWLHMYRKMVR
jgi:hypothetical protein